MKKLIYILPFFLLVSNLSMSQDSLFVNISGNVNDLDGNPIGGHEVYFEIQQGGFIINDMVLTNNTGHYEYTFAAFPLGNAEVGVYDCNNDFISQTLNWSPNATFLIADFDICNENVPGDCENWFTYQVSPLGLVTFTGESNPPTDNYFWEFGDGNTGYGQTVDHVYDPNAGNVFLVTLTTFHFDPATGDSCMATSTQEVWLNNTGDCENWFTYEQTGDATFFFTGEAMPETDEYFWEFGDGTTGFGQQIEHTYDPNAGDVFLVTLTTFHTNPGTIDTCTAVSMQEIWINSNNCQAFFESEPFPESLFSYQFTDLSTGNIAEWSWEFGDGSVSDLQNPIHTYDQPGMYEVCLTVYSGDPVPCSDAYCKIIEVDQPGCQAAFGFTLDTISGLMNNFNFTDLSTGGPNQWLWDFGDGTTSIQQNPVHQYDSSGTYHVCLVATTTHPSYTCSDTICQEVITPEYFNLGGFAFAGDYPLNNPYPQQDTGIAYLYRIYGNKIYPDDSVLFYENGYYPFLDKREGDYLIKVCLTENSTHYDSYLPTYHNSGLFWHESQQISLNDSSIFHAHTDLRPVSPIESGVGQIGGNIIIDPGYKATNIGVVVILYNDDMNPVFFRHIMGSEQFFFDNLPYGKYYLYAEQTGMYSNYTEVVIDESTPVINSVVLVISDIPSATNEPEKTPLTVGKVFPNPVGKNLNLELHSQLPMQIELTLFSAQGHVMEIRSYQLTQGKSIVSKAVDDLKKGMYLLKISNNKLKINKVVKFVK